MSSHLELLHDIVSAAFLPSWKAEQKQKYTEEINDLLFSKSPATMTLEEIQEMQQIRAVLGPSLIFKLPTELFWKIFNLLSHKDRGSFRYANKQLCALVKLPFAKTIPSIWAFEFTQKSLEELNRLTHDLDLVPYCNGILIGAAPKTSKDRTQQLNFLQRGSHIEALFKAMSSLQANGVSSGSFGVCDNIAESQKPRTNNPASAKRSSNNKHLRNTLAALCVAIRLTKSPVDYIWVEAGEGPVITESADMFWTDLQPVPDFLMYLGRSRNRPASTAISTRRSRLKLKHHCITTLENDNPTNAIMLSENNYGYLHGIIYHGNYEEKVFYHIQTDYASCLELVVSQTLRRLDLKCVNFFHTNRSDPATVSQFCQSLRGLPSLESLTLDRLIDHRDDQECWIQENKVRWQGKEEIRAGLDGLLVKIAHWI